MRVKTTLDDRLIRALREGGAALPDDLTLLKSYLKMIDRLLAEKAVEVEPSWSQACDAAAEIQTLQTLEEVVAERTIAVKAGDLGAVRAKLEIWRALAPGAPEGDLGTLRSRLILSVEADLQRLSSDARA